MQGLESIDRALLGGEFGPAAAHAMKLLVKYGEARGASRFVSIASAHIDGCLYHGPSSTDFVRRFVDLKGRVRVPTTLNVAAVDVTHPEWHCGATDLIPAQSELTMLHEVLGCVPSLTCAPYQRMIRPRMGEHVAWAESNAIVFVNSVLGARTDRYGDFTDLCAALTGRVPLAGLHLDENRRAELWIDIVGHEQSGLARDIYFACVGYVLGARAAGRVPLISGLPDDTNEDDLKAIGAAAASSGATALFHALGITPEAATVECATGGRAIAKSDPITRQDLEGALHRLCPLVVGEPISAMCLGTPHFSVTEFQTLAALLEGRRPAAGVEAYVSTSREIAAQIRDEPWFASIEDFGVRIVVDVCTYMAPVVRNMRGAIVTNAAKAAHYGPGNINRRIGLMTMERCVRSAELGAVAP
jgi:predicted aconitase